MTPIALMLAEQTETTGIGRGVLFFLIMYFVIKWAVKNGVEEAYREITDNDNDDNYYHL